MTQSLYERLGGADGVTAIARGIVARHSANPLIMTRFAESDVPELEQHIEAFISMGTGGPNVYKGRDMVTAHTGMNVNERELIAVFDDAMAALTENGIGDQERGEFLAILYSLKDDVLFK